MNIVIDIRLLHPWSKIPIVIGFDPATSKAMRGTLLDAKTSTKSPSSTLKRRFPYIARYVAREYQLTHRMVLLSPVVWAGTGPTPPANRWVFQGYGSTVTINDISTRAMTRPSPRFMQMFRAAGGR